ncbi:MAG: cob(I)yrinic acid a,c-diamide adenosyltransferase [Gammaproteobacteria bacterium]|jgi:cob(I)alamin adenosyltransferase|nr:cob(I)yrinic acid a,c-diamide adenosyltransferase [Gammaproteobacteria bacterium]
MTTKTHAQRMAAKKAVIDARIAKATEERGVVILLRGNGKGKSSSAFGTLMRSLGHGKAGAVVQFVKGRIATGEHKFFQTHTNIPWHIMGHGFTWETQDKGRDIAAAEQAWEITQKLLQDDSIDMLVLDEMAYIFKYNYLPVEPVIEALKRRPAKQTVIITGRVMPDALVDYADTVSTVKDDGHAFRRGVKAQAGIEY